MPGATLDQKNKTFTVSQSWLGTYLRCPSLAGRELRDEVPLTETDATALGTAWHLYAELRALGYPEHEALHKAQGEMNALVSLEHFRFVQIKTVGTMELKLQTLARLFEERIMPQLGTDPLLEHTFNAPLTTHEGWEIRLKGTVDRVDNVWGLIDYKTAGRIGPGTPWDKFSLKYKIQADAYTYASTMDETMRDYLKHTTATEAVDFTWIVATKSTVPELIWPNVTKTIADWVWLKQIGANALESALADVWAVSHTTPLCSPKWCGAWGDCRGAESSPVKLADFPYDPADDHAWS